MDTGQPAALRFDTLVEQSPTGIYVVQDERFVYVNPQMGRIFGYEPAELLGLASVLDVVHPADRDRVRELLRQRTSGEIDNVRSTWRGIRKNGDARQIETLGRPATFAGRAATSGSRSTSPNVIVSNRSSRRGKPGFVRSSRPRRTSCSRATSLGESRP